MTGARAASAYRKVDLESAPKEQILDRLLERFLADVAAARAAIARGDIEAKAKSIGHAAAIIVELNASLDATAAPELCANLASLYDYANERLNVANVKLSVAALDDASRIIGVLGDAFRQARAR